MMNLAIIVPYRDRAEHLAQFVPALHAHLVDTPHHIYVVEQCDDKAFNRGKLLNVGFEVASGTSHTSGNDAAKRSVIQSREVGGSELDYRSPQPANGGLRDLAQGPTHVVFHDIDMLPVDVTYAGERPTHLAGAASQFNYRLPYPEYFGGVTLFPVEDFRTVNGFNNDYWGWGCEDDDLHDRCVHHGLVIDRVPGRFESLSHTSWTHDERSANGYRANQARLRANRHGNREYDTNGLNTLEYGFRAWVAIDPLCTLLKIEL